MVNSAAAREGDMSYHAGLWPNLPRVECDGVNCERHFDFDTGPKIPRCIETRTPPARGWETTIHDGKRYDHCPDCVAPARET